MASADLSYWSTLWNTIEMPSFFTTARPLARRHGVVRSKELEAAGIARSQLSRMVANGELQRISRGLYTLPNSAPTPDEGLLQVIRRHPNTRLCLLTALRLHSVTTQAPFEVWIAIGHKDRAPIQKWPPLRVVRYSGEALDAGLMKIKTGGVSVRVTNIAKTITDCFKFRHLIGLDVALEAIREALLKRHTNADELWRYAKICRVTRIMRPYLEALA
jgi:predicted transcriptional regulator of viral defense system